MSSSPIEDYLDSLFTRLGADAPRQARWMLAEAEAHLRDAADAAERTGMTTHEAELAAVERFGEASTVALADRDRHPTGLITRVFVSAWTLGALGAVAVGISGLIAGVMQLAGASNQFLAGRPLMNSLGSGGCARWLAHYPHAASCAEAATATGLGKRSPIGSRVASSAFSPSGPLPSPAVSGSAFDGAALPKIVVGTIATVGFAATGIWLAGMGIDDLIVNSGNGAGQWLSAAPVALAASILFGVPFAKRVNNLPSAV